MSSTSLLGGAAVLVAAIGAMTAGQPISSASAVTALRGSTPAAHAVSRQGGNQVSRAGQRPAVDATNQIGATRREVLARDRQLRAVDGDAKRYADRLTRNQWVTPTVGFHISEWFGDPGWYWASGYHTGIDFATACGTPAFAVSGGVVTRAGWDGSYGYQVRLRLRNDDQVWYNHLSLIQVSTGQAVSKAQQVGEVGATGNAYGCHLHFEYHVAGHLRAAVDPAPYFQTHGITLR